MTTLERDKKQSAPDNRITYRECLSAIRITPVMVFNFLCRNPRLKM